MRSTLIIRARLPKGGNRPGAIGQAVNRAVLEFERDVKEHIQTSVPAGRTYRTTPIVRTGSRRRQVPGLRGRGRRGVIVGYNFHRASRRGQPPAILSGRLINSIRSQMIGPTAGRVSVGVFYGLILDDPNGLDRPFFHSRAELFRPRFFQLVADAARGGSGE